MKRIILIAAMALGFVVTAAAANPINKIENKFGGKARAVGLRLGYTLEATYQHSFGSNFVQADLGFLGFNTLNAVATYNWMLAQPDWTSRGKWGVYAGPGAGVGFSFAAEYVGFNIAAAGLVGLEYTFWFPLQLSVDIRPQLGIHLGRGRAFYADGYYPTLSARYCF